MAAEHVLEKHVIVRSPYIVYQLTIGNKAYVGVQSKDKSLNIHYLLFGQWYYPYLSPTGKRMIDTDELREECGKDSFKFCDSHTQIVKLVDSPYEAFCAAQEHQKTLSEQYEMVSKNPGIRYKKLKFYSNQEIAEMQSELDELLQTEKYCEAWYRVRMKHGVKGRVPAYTPGLKCIMVPECT